MKNLQWFSDPCDTLELCKQVAGILPFFEGVGIFQTPEGKYVSGNIRQSDFTMGEARALGASIEQLTGNKLLYYHGGLGWWCDVNTGDAQS